MTGPVMDRRTTIAWLAAAMASLPAAANGMGLQGVKWPADALPPITAPGYGGDPDLLDPKVPWPLTMTAAERAATTALVDMMLPAEPAIGASAASALGVPAFVDEWISAPYPAQQDDRSLIVPGLAWVDAESSARFGKPFAAVTNAQRAAICDDIAFRGRVKPGLEQAARFFDRVRSIALLAYYSTEEGWQQIGYLGNTPTTGPYPGPTPEALAHLRGVLTKLGLPPV